MPKMAPAILLNIPSATIFVSPSNNIARKNIATEMLIHAINNEM